MKSFKNLKRATAYILIRFLLEVVHNVNEGNERVAPNFKEVGNSGPTVMGNYVMKVVGCSSASHKKNRSNDGTTDVLNCFFL